MYKPRSGYCIHPLLIGGRKKPSDPVVKHDAKRLKECHRTFDLWKAGKYTPATHRKQVPS